MKLRLLVGGLNKSYGSPLLVFLKNEHLAFDCSKVSSPMTVMGLVIT